jgi:hypothetical protein
VAQRLTVRADRSHLGGGHPGVVQQHRGRFGKGQADGAIDLCKLIQR